MKQVLESVELPTVAVLAGVVGAMRNWAMYLTPHFRDVGFRLNRCLPKDGSEGLTAYTTATRPAASAAPGAIIYVSDGAAGAKFQGSDGTNWVNLG